MVILLHSIENDIHALGRLYNSPAFWGNMTLAVDFRQLSKIQFQLGSILSISGNRIFGNYQKSTAKVNTAKFMLPIKPLSILTHVKQARS
jgi:hypothetical protein